MICFINWHDDWDLSDGEPVLYIGGMGAFFQGKSSKKRPFGLLAPPKKMPFLTISHKNIFFKIQGSRLGAIVAPNKSLE